MVLLVYVSDGQNGGSLLVYNTAESGLALNNDIGDILLTAQGGQPQYKLSNELISQ